MARIGLERLLRVPAWRVQLLVGGAVMVTLHPSTGGDEAMIRGVAEHLGLRTEILYGSPEERRKYLAPMFRPAPGA